MCNILKTCSYSFLALVTFLFLLQINRYQSIIASGEINCEMENRLRNAGEELSRFQMRNEEVERWLLMDA